MTRAHGQLTTRKVSAVDPVDPLGACAEGHAQQRNGNAQRTAPMHTAGGVDAEQSGDERLGAGLAWSWRSPQGQEFSTVDSPKALLWYEFLRTPLMLDAAADDLVAPGNIAGEASPVRALVIRGNCR